jgi:hypothetical protein
MSAKIIADRMHCAKLITKIPNVRAREDLWQLLEMLKMAAFVNQMNVIRILTVMVEFAMVKLSNASHCANKRRTVWMEKFATAVSV